MNVTSFNCGPFANESERTAFEHLRSRIKSSRRAGDSSRGAGDDQWILLTNLTWSVTHQFQADEIDMIAIGPPGVRVIEVKHWSRKWVDEHPNLVDPEADRVTNKARKIGTTSRKSVGPDLGHVDGVILLTRESPDEKKLAGRVVRGVRFCTLKEWRTAIDFNAAPVLCPQQVARLGRLLEPKSAVALDGSLRRFAGYINLERRTPPSERFHRVYAGSHASQRGNVILHLYDLSASDETNAETRAKREFETLYRLQQHPWAPRVRDSWQPAPGYAGEMYFFTVKDPLAPSVEKRASDQSWDTRARLAFARAALGALGGLHGETADGAPILHRNLTPGTVLVRHNNTPIFTGFELSRIPSETSVGSVRPPSSKWPPSTAPEVRGQGLHEADTRSDHYGLCASLRVLFEDRHDETSPQALEVLASGMADDPTQRSEPSELDERLAALLGEPRPAPPPPPAQYWTEEQVVPFRGDHYRVVQRLGSGGVGTTFKVVQLDRTTQEERGTYVAKVCHDEDAGRRAVSAYELARSHLRHQAVSAIFEVASEWCENGFTVLMTWVDGQPLRDFLDPEDPGGDFSFLADYLEEAREGLAVRWLRGMCIALRVFHDRGLVHGDVSPANIILSGRDLVLTDYDFVTEIHTERTTTGTCPYAAPVGETAQPSDDIYALAASFFHLLFQRAPFRYDGAVAKEQGLNWDGIDPDEYTALRGFLNQATHPSPDQRFPSVGKALGVLDSVKECQLTNIKEGLPKPAPVPLGSLRYFSWVAAVVVTVLVIGVAVWPITGPRTSESGEVFRDDCPTCPDLVVVPGGMFVMGSGPGNTQGLDDERPQHTVRVGRFALGVHEVTRAQYAAFVAATGRALLDLSGGCIEGFTLSFGASWRAPGFSQEGEHPVVCVDWKDAQAYARWLSAETGAEYRLPSEAEWEYAARAGTGTRRYWGNRVEEQCDYANGADRSARANRFGGPTWDADCDDGWEFTAPVGSFAPNQFGLHDMLGNVWEWLQDCRHDNYEGTSRDGSALSSRGDCVLRVTRGGSWSDFPVVLRSATRGSNQAGRRKANLGFRVARTLE